jgi:membrane fusion protein, multidrug efflux system
MTQPKKWLLLPPVVVGVLLVVFAARGKKPPTIVPPAPNVRALRVLSVPKLSVVPRVTGYGTAQPGRVWRCVPEVAGRLTLVAANLEAGQIMREGEVIAKIDSATYALTVTRLEAEISQTQAQLAELEAQVANVKASLSIERDALELAKKDLARTQELRKEGTATHREVEQAERTLLTQRQSIRSLDNTLALVPAQRKALEALVRVQRASLAQAKLELDKTELTLPFTGRIGDVALEPGQYVKAGEHLFEVHGTDVVEIEAQVPLGKAKSLFSMNEQPLDLTQLDADSLAKRFGLSAVVRLRAGDQQIEWPARVTRIRERLDQETRAISFVVAVDGPYLTARPGTRPPLLSGMFCAVELRGPAQPDRLVIPRSSLQEGHLYVVADGKLARRSAKVDYLQGDLAIVRSGVAEGESLVVSDPTPATEGMAVEPRDDLKLRALLISRATDGPK